MRVFKQILTMVLLAAILSLTGLTGGTALGQRNDNRPPKDPQKIKDKEKDKPPPSNNSNKPKKP